MVKAYECFFFCQKKRLKSGLVICKWRTSFHSLALFWLLYQNAKDLEFANQMDKSGFEKSMDVTNFPLTQKDQSHYIMRHESLGLAMRN